MGPLIATWKELVPRLVHVFPAWHHTKEPSSLALADWPAAKLLLPLAVLPRPPATVEPSPLAVLTMPPATVESGPLAVLESPPATVETGPLAVLWMPPPTVAE